MYAESGDSYTHFASQLGVLVPEKVLPQNSSVALVKVASRYGSLLASLGLTARSQAPCYQYDAVCCRLIGPHSWPVTNALVASLHDVSKKLSSAMQANCTTELLPSPLAFSSTRGLGLTETKHLEGELVSLLSSYTQIVTSSFSVKAGHACWQASATTIHGLCTFYFLHCCTATSNSGACLCMVSWHSILSMWKCILWSLLNSLDMLGISPDTSCNVASPQRFSPPAHHITGPRYNLSWFGQRPCLDTVDAVISCSMNTHSHSSMQGNIFSRFTQVW